LQLYKNEYTIAMGNVAHNLPLYKPDPTATATQQKSQQAATANENGNGGAGIQTDETQPATGQEQDDVQKEVPTTQGQKKQ
jgi:hypothetical protein